MSTLDTICKSCTTSVVKLWCTHCDIIMPQEFCLSHFPCWIRYEHNICKKKLQYILPRDPYLDK